jgi:hypothetical protein
MNEDFDRDPELFNVESGRLRMRVEGGAGTCQMGIKALESSGWFT